MTIPRTCTIGETTIDTETGIFYQCVDVNSWTPISAGGQVTCVAVKNTETHPIEIVNIVLLFLILTAMILRMILAWRKL
jgi:hypothetical protein